MNTGILLVQVVRVVRQFPARSCLAYSFANLPCLALSKSFGVKRPHICASVARDQIG